MALLQANDMVHWKCWCILGVPMRGLSQLSWYLQRLPWAFDKTYLGSRLQALAEGRSNVLRGWRWICNKYYERPGAGGRPCLSCMRTRDFASHM